VRLRRRRTTRRETSNVDVTAFLSLMVILVPFLLITAVFSRITILELEGLSDTNAQRSLDNPVQLQVVVRESFLEVKYGREATARIERTASGRELESLAMLVDNLKARYPRSLNATILLEPEIPYDVLVQVMDVVRLKQRRRGGVLEKRELFPNIALGSVTVIDQRTRDVK